MREKLTKRNRHTTFLKIKDTRSNGATGERESPGNTNPPKKKERTSQKKNTEMITTTTSSVVLPRYFSFFFFFFFPIIKFGIEFSLTTDTHIVSLAGRRECETAMRSIIHLCRVYQEKRPLPPPGRDAMARCQNGPPTCQEDDSFFSTIKISPN